MILRHNDTDRLQLLLEIKELLRLIVRLSSETAVPKAADIVMIGGINFDAAIKKVRKQVDDLSVAPT